DVYFLTPGIFADNRDRYEFRVYLNDSTTMVPWSYVGRFTDHRFQLNEFRRDFGFLGGYRTTWGNYLTAELRETGTKKLLSVARVYWKEIKPRIESVFTGTELTDFLLRTKRPFDEHVDVRAAPKRSDTLKPEDNQLILFMAADIYKRAALEYRVMRNGRLLVDWRPNDFDNNAVRLKTLAPGDYRLELRYRRQRQNITEYSFHKEPFWYQRGWVWPAVLLVVVGFGVLLTRLLILRRQKRALADSNRKMSAVASELRYIQAQLNPHFIFNALGSIQGLINKNDVSQANYYLTEFSSLLRETLGGDEKGMVPLKGELKMLQRYLNLEQLRFNFTSEIRVDKGIKENEVSFPALLLQPLVENAIKHGIPGMQREGVIRIILRDEGGNLEVTISDNGKGFDPGSVGEGLGLKLTRERFSISPGAALPGGSNRCPGVGCRGGEEKDTGI
ncbi:MAG TPA: histidine kinase, partial [Puia sp.]|nr:histidine kinase [Puia sp.]